MYMIRKKLIVPIVLIVCCLLLGISIGNTAETVTEIGVNVLKGSINGTCFNDVNQDGKINQGEQGIPGVTVTLRRFSFFGFSFKDVASIETDAEGKYLFSVNKAGIYQIEESDPPGSTSTTPNKVVFYLGQFNTRQVIFFGDIIDSSTTTIPVTTTMQATTTTIPATTTIQATTTTIPVTTTMHNNNHNTGNHDHTSDNNYNTGNHDHTSDNNHNTGNHDDYSNNNEHHPRAAYGYYAGFIYWHSRQQGSDAGVGHRERNRKCWL